MIYSNQGVLRNLSKPIMAIKATNASLPAWFAAFSHLTPKGHPDQLGQVWLSGVVDFPVIPSQLLNAPFPKTKRFFRPKPTEFSLPRLPKPYLWITHLKSRLVATETLPNLAPVASTPYVPEGFVDPVMAVYTSLTSISMYVQVTCPDGTHAVYLNDGASASISCPQGLGHLQRNLDSITLTLTSTVGAITKTFGLTTLRCSYNPEDQQAPVDCLQVIMGLIPYAHYAISVKFAFVDISTAEVFLTFRCFYF